MPSLSSFFTVSSSVAPTAPAAVGTPSDMLGIVQGVANPTQDMKPFFSGTVKSWSIVNGVGASIDSSGIVSISSSATQASQTIRVRASNDYGYDEQTFASSVVAATVPFPTFADSNWSFIELTAAPLGRLQFSFGANALDSNFTYKLTTSDSDAMTLALANTGYTVVPSGTNNRVPKVSGLTVYPKITAIRNTDQAFQVIASKAPYVIIGDGSGIETEVVFATVSTLAQLSTAIRDCPIGQTILMTGGNKSGTLVYTTPTTKSTPIKIRAADPGNPPVLKETALTFVDFDGLVIDGLHFDSDVADLRTQYFPFCVRMVRCANWTIQNCTMMNFWGAIDISDKYGTVTKGIAAQNAVVRANKCVGSRCDVFRFYENVRNVHLHHNEVINCNVNPNWQGDTNRHPDIFQLAANHAGGGADGVIFEDNFIDVNQPNIDYGILLNSEAVLKDGKPFDNHWSHRNIIVRRNNVVGTKCFGVMLGGVKHVIVQDNYFNRSPGSATTDVRTPQVYAHANLAGNTYIEDCLVQNNSWPLIAGQSTLKYGNGDQTNLTKVGNLIAPANKPVGWAGFDVAKGVYGPYCLD